MNNKIKYLFGLLVAACLGVLIYVAIGPFISLHGVKKGIDEENTLILEHYIDFPELRKNVRIRARQQLMESMGFDLSQSDNVLARFAMEFADQMIDIGVDAAISPQGLALMMAGNDLNDVMLKSKLNQLEEPDEIETKTFIDVLKNSEFSYLNHHEFSFTFKNENMKYESEGEKEKTTIIFHRIGLKWKLSDVIFAMEDNNDE